MRKKIFSILALIAIHSNVLAQNVNIPDANFKAYLVGNSAINTNADSEIQLSEATAYTGVIACSNLAISDLTGIESFISIIVLSCEYNNLTSLNLSQNTSLIAVNCDWNDLTNLNVSQNAALSNLSCEYNTILSLDLSNCSSLSNLKCTQNSLTSLDLSNNPNLTTLECGHNNFSVLDVSNNNNLWFLQCVNTSITTLDLSNNSNLTNLQCGANSLMDSLDLSQNPLLNSLFCQSNNLVYLNMHNLSTTTLTTFYAVSNPSLTCILADDPIAASIAWTNIDPIASFNTSCIVLVSSISIQGQGGVSTISTNGMTLQMEATVLPFNASDDNYTWTVTNGTGSASIDMNGLLTPILNGTVVVTATANDGSGISGDAVITISNQSNMGIYELYNADSITVYPNPSSSHIKINFSDEKNYISATIIDAMGRSFLANLSSDNTIDISNLCNGVYTLQLLTKEGIFNKKFIKE